MTPKKPSWIPEVLKKRVSLVKEVDNHGYFVRLSKSWICKRDLLLGLENCIEFYCNDQKHIQNILIHCVQISDGGWDLMKKNQTELNTINSKIYALETENYNARESGDMDKVKNISVELYELYEERNNINDRIKLTMSFEK